MKFKHQIKKKLKGIIPDELIDFLPSGVQIIDYVAIINLNPKLYEYKLVIAQAIMDLIPYIKSVWLKKGKIVGQLRKPSELEYVLGVRSTEVVHKENELKYYFDFTKIMFSKGNINERMYLPRLIRNNEIVIDMFAGIGYFSLGIAKFSNAKKIYAIELNPESYEFLVKNIKINNLENKLEPLLGDCKIIVPQLSQKNIIADRIIMGVFPAPYNYLDAATTIVKRVPLSIKTDINKFQEAAQITYKAGIYPQNLLFYLDKEKSNIKKQLIPPEKFIVEKTTDLNFYTNGNTILHFEGVVMGRNIKEMYLKVQYILNNYNLKTSLLAFRFVKSFGPKLWHLVLDIAVGI